MCQSYGTKSKEWLQIFQDKKKIIGVQIDIVKDYVMSMKNQRMLQEQQETTTEQPENSNITSEEPESISNTTT